MRQILLVTGVPGSGKTTLAVPLASRLGVPLIEKDVIKEALFATLGAESPSESRALGAASFEVMFALAASMPAIMLEGNFDRSLAASRVLTLCTRPLEIFCRCSAELAMSRYRARTRDPRHFDSLMAPELERRLAEGGAEPLDLGGPVLEVNTNEPVAVETVARWAFNEARLEAAAPLGEADP